MTVSGPVRWRAPGRANLIGEHTDYNEGFVLPFAIAAGCTATVEPLEAPGVAISSVQFGDAIELPLARLHPGPSGWWTYPAGVVWALREAGHEFGGVRIAVDSDVPTGAGLSSSAALVCSVAAAVDDRFDLGLDAEQLLAVSRRAENDFVGAPTGGMDQLAALRCRPDHALFCDMRSLAVEQVPFDLAAHGLTILVIDSRAPHAHAEGEYRARRDGCAEAARLIGVRALRDVGADQLDDALRALPDETLRRYVRHIVTEDERVLRTVELLRVGRVADIGPLLTASHESMRDDFRITIAPIDLAVETLLSDGALGARMTGGGFGGCVIALLDASRADDAAAAVERAYAAHGFRPPGHFTVRPARGAHRL